jgi:hypothetical protein
MRITYCENYVNVICVLILYFLYATLTTKSLIYSIFPIEAVIKMFLQLSLSDVSLTGRYCAFCMYCTYVYKYSMLTGICRALPVPRFCVKAFDYL